MKSHSRPSRSPSDLVRRPRGNPEYPTGQKRGGGGIKSLLWLLVFLLPSCLNAQDRQVDYQQKFDAEFWAQQPAGVLAYTMCGEELNDSAFTTFRPGTDSLPYFGAIEAHEAIHRQQAQRFANCHAAANWYRDSARHAAQDEAEAYAETLRWLVAHGEDEYQWRSTFVAIMYSMFGGKVNVGEINDLLNKFYRPASPFSN